MAKIANPSKVSKFAVEIDGLDQFLVQECSIPTPEIAVTEHGDTNHPVKTAGLVSVGDVELKKLRVADGSDRWAWDWLNQAQDMIGGSGSLPSEYKKTIVIKQLAGDGKTTVNSWTCFGAWPSKIALSPFNRQSSDNTIETVTLTIDEIQIGS